MEKISIVRAQYYEAQITIHGGRIMNECLVSFIVPVYNAARTLNTCIDSIRNQTYTFFEIILINDGSTDESGVICDAFSKQDFRIRTFHQKNKGAAAARNKGIHHAIGTYIQFVDADDYIEPHMTQTLVDQMTEEVDLVICGYTSNVARRGKDRITTHLPSVHGTFSHEEYITHIGTLYAETIFPSPCNKLYKSDVILAERVRFMDAFRMGEDVLFNIDYMEVCNAVAVVPEALYTYIIRDEESLSRRYHPNYVHYQIHIHSHILEFLQRKDKLHGKNNDAIQMMFMRSMMNSFTHLFHPDNEDTKHEKKEHIATIIEDSSIQNKVNHLRGSLQARIIRTFIVRKSVQGIYAFFLMKQTIKTNIYPLYKLLKKLDTRTKEVIHP